MVSRPFAFVALAIVLSAAPAHAVDRTWTGAAGDGLWNTPANWSGTAVPGPSDHALVTLAGTYTVRLTTPVSVARLTLGGSGSAPTLDATGFQLDLGAGLSVVEAGAVLAVGRADRSSNALYFDGPVAVRGRLDWAGGQLYGNTYGAVPGAKILTVAPGGLFRWVGAAERTLSAVLDNRGTIRWEGGPTDYYQGYQFLTSSGLFEIALASDAEFRGVGVNNLGPWIWASTGTVRKTGAGTVTFNQVELRTVGGSVDVVAGALVLTANTRWENATLAVAAGGTLRLGGSEGNTWHEVAGTLTGSPAGAVALGGTSPSGPGLVAPAGGTVALGGTGLQVIGSRLGGRFANGAYEASPTNTGLVRFVGTTNSFVAGSFRNEGTVRWEGGPLSYSFTAAITNAGLFEMAPATDQTFFTSGVNGLRPGALVNTGTLRKSGSATVETNVEFDHVGGAADVLGGTLRVQWGGRFENAAVNVAAGAALRLAFGGPPTVVAGTLTGTAAGLFSVRERAMVADAAGGRISIGGTGLVLEYQGSLGGNPDGQGVRAAPVNGGVVRFADIDATVGGAFRNEGTARWEAGLLRFAPGIMFTNAGLFELASDNQTLYGASFFAGSTLVNEPAGTVRKVGPGFVNLQTALMNRGRLVVAGGTLRMENTGFGGFTNAFEGVVSGTGTLDVAPLPGDRVANTGRTAPGPGDDGVGTGTLTWGGPYTPGPQSRLVVEVGPGPVGDRLVVTGPAALGSLQALVRVVGGYVPQAGDVFDVLTAASVTPLDTVQTVNASGNVVFAPDYAVPGVVTLRAEAGTPAPPVVVSPSPIVNGGRRTATLFADGLTAGSRAFLVCSPCLVGGSQRIAGEVVGAVSGGVEVRFDLTSPEILGDYTLVVSAGADSLRSPVRVVPYVAVPLIVQASAPGVVIRPAPLAGTSFVNVYNATNSGEPAIFYVRFDPPSPAIRYAASNLETAPGLPETAPDFFLPVASGLLNPTTVPFATGIDPADVLFPGQTPGTGANVPLGSPQVVQATGVGFVAPDQFARGFADLMREVAGDLGGQIDDDDALAAARIVVADLADGGDFGAGGGLRRIFGELTGTITGALGPGGTTVLNLQPGVVLPPGFGAGLTEALEGIGEGIAAPPGRPGACTVQLQHPTPVTDEMRRVAELLQGMSSVQQEQFRRAIENVGSPRGMPLLGGCPTDGDVEPQLPQPVVGPLDPNDKAPGVAIGCELVGTGEAARCGRYLIPLASRAEPLDYTVQFENVPDATANAETVTITDVLDGNLDPATFEVLASTADSLLTTTVVGQTVTFTFTGIDLPPNQTAPEGQGAVTYRVSPRPGLVDGTEIRNRASIVFDFNPPIVTPEVVHVVRATADLAVSIAAPDFGPFQTPLVYTVRAANPAGADPAESVALTVPIPAGTTLLSATTTAGSCSGTTTLSCALGTLAGGAEALVTVTVQLPQTGGTQAVLTASGTTATFDGAWYNDAASRTFGITNGTAGEDAPGLPAEVVLDGNRPNPFSERTVFRVGLPAASSVTVVVVDLLGREVVRAAEGPMEAGWHEVAVEGRGLASGVYVAVLRAGDIVRTRRVLVVR
jgi:hypothetical protein